MSPTVPTIHTYLTYLTTGAFRETNSPIRCSTICTATPKTKQDNTLTTSCGHAFHRACLVAHLAVAETCPQCKTCLSTGMKQATQSVDSATKHLHTVVENMRIAVAELEKGSSKRKEKTGRDGKKAGMKKMRRGEKMKARAGG